MRYIIILLLLLSCTKEFQPEPEFIDVPQDTIPVPHILISEIIYPDFRYYYEYSGTELTKRFEYTHELVSTTYYDYTEDSIIIKKYKDGQLDLIWEIYLQNDTIKEIKTEFSVVTFSDSGYVKYFIGANQFDTFGIVCDNNIKELKHTDYNRSEYFTHDNKINPLKGRFYYLMEDYLLYFNNNNILTDSNINRVIKYNYTYAGDYPVKKISNKSIVTFKYDTFFNSY